MSIGLARNASAPLLRRAGLCIRNTHRLGADAAHTTLVVPNSCAGKNL
ncbi:MAG: hypothetical protein IJ191_02415 [Treponema sp.]|nr:hypothetical protein [Treponema sp.]